MGLSALWLLAKDMPWRLIGVGTVIAVLLAMTGCAKLDARKWHGRYDTLLASRNVVLVAIQDVAANSKLKWKDAAAQVRLVGESRDSWRTYGRGQSEKIGEMGRDAERLKALSTEAQRVAKRLIAQRDTAIERLEKRALTPWDRSDCARQLREAEDALDYVWGAGL